MADDASWRSDEDFLGFELDDLEIEFGQPSELENNEWMHGLLTNKSSIEFRSLMLNPPPT